MTEPHGTQQFFHGRRDAARAALVALVLCAGCSDRAVVETATEVPTGVDLRLADRAELDARVGALQGKVVLVDFWATWCAPCVEQLPHTANLARNATGRDLAVITVCMDDPDDAAAAAKVLAAHGVPADAQNLISRDGGGSRAMNAFEIDGGALPHYKLYDKTGQLSRTFGLDPAADVQFTTADIDAAIAEVLAAP
jgi:thiol-disulfide isomerase/thioredoxin